MSVGLSGSLADFSIADVFQLIGQQRKTGLLELRNAAQRAQLLFDQGLVVSALPGKERSGDLDPVADRLVRCGLLTRDRADEAQTACRSAAQPAATLIVERGWCAREAVAEVEELVTRDTIFEVLRWREGSFDFRAEAVTHARDRSRLLGAEQILMDGLRMVDEWQSFAEHVPSEETVFQRAGPFDRFLDRADRLGDAERRRAERVYQLVDGRISTRRVIDLARLGTFDGVRCLAELCRAGAIRALHPESVRRVRRLMAGDAQRALWLRTLAAGLAPLGVLALAVAWVSGAPGAARPVHPIEVSGLAALEEAYAARAVRQALEAHRLQAGAWAGALAELESDGWLPAGALATPHGRSYYSMHRDRGLVFLAPERSPRGSR